MTPLEEVFNFRDLGGHRTADGSTVRSGLLYRSDSLHRLSAPDCEQLGSLGLRTVVDLRRPNEVDRDGREPAHLGLAYHNPYPVHREWDDTPYRAEAGADRYLADRYADMAAEGIEGLGAALRLIGDRDNAPLVIHCFAGKDRTGVLSALVLSLLGVPDPVIAADYARSGAAQPALSARLRRDFPRMVTTVPNHFLLCPPQAMLLFLAELRERYGSVTGYAARAGVTDDHLAGLRGYLDL